MSQKHTPKTDPDQQLVYEIRIRGHLGPQWEKWFEGMKATLEENGETVLSGPVVDQSALYGLVKKVRDLGLTLISVNRLDPDEGGAPKSE